MGSAYRQLPNLFVTLLLLYIFIYFECGQSLPEASNGIFSGRRKLMNPRDTWLPSSQIQALWSDEGLINHELLKMVLL